MALNERLSDDAIVNIFVRLPLKDVARTRVVCKRWHALTSEHHFLRATFSRTTGQGQYPIAGFFLSDQLHRKFSYSPLVGHGTPAGSSSNHPIIPDLSFVPGDPAVDGGQVYVTSSCNGLLICSRPNNQVPWKPACFVCNPVTRTAMAIDVPEGVDRYLFLAYDPSRSRHYQIVAFGGYGLHLYSSEARSWRASLRFDRSSYPFSGLHSCHSVFWGGSLVWLVSNRLVRFAVAEEHVADVPMPPAKPEGWICAYVGESGGHLQMIGFTQEERLAGFLDVLEMQQEAAGWSLLYRVDIRRVAEMHPEIRRVEPEFPWLGLRFPVRPGRMIEYLALWPIYVVRGSTRRSGGGALLFSILGRVMCCSTDDQAISTVRDEVEAPGPRNYQYQWYHFHPYSLSLFALRAF